MRKNNQGLSSTIAKMKTIIISSMFFLLFWTNLSAQIEMDSIELVKLYNATNGENWNNPWDLQTPVSD